jgi:hypothetical protein
MSEATKKAIFSKLKGGTALVALLGKDENSDPAVFNKSYNQVTAELVEAASETLYPLLTFREDIGSADLRFRAENVGSEVWDIEAWAKDESALVVPSILDSIDSLLHNQSVTVTGGTVFDCVRLSQNPDLYDEKRKLHFGLARYRLIVQRN